MLQLTAIYEESEGSSSTSKYIGDGTSTCNSSVGTASPVMLDHNHINNSNNKYNLHHPSSSSSYHHHNDFGDEDSDEIVVVTGQEISKGRGFMFLILMVILVGNWVCGSEDVLSENPFSSIDL